MTSTATCPRCGTELFGEAGAGLCPKCLGNMSFSIAAASTENHGPFGNADTETSLHQLGDYELIEEIARGGMGVVYKARQKTLDRIVAVKVVLHGPFSSAEFAKRFRTEAAAVAALRHPNIVAVYEAGQQGADQYLAMEYIEGQNLAEAVRSGPMPARRAAAYLKAISEAVEYAHHAGVLHRDLKPSNVLLDGFDQPRLTDFGLAKLVNSDSELTTTGQVLGSPGHMPPEQAAGGFGQAGPAADIYSLGAILYHLLTGRPPFQGETLPEILLQVSESDPVLPQRLNPSVPLDLQTICLKCLQKNPHNRYPTAGDLAADLGRFLANEPIRARPIGFAGRAVRWCRRKPALAAALGAAAVLLLVISFGSPIALVHIDRERRVAEAARIRAETAEKQTQQQLFSSLVEQARATVRSGELGHRVRSLDAVRRAAAITNTPELGREALAALALPDLRFKTALPLGTEYSLRKLSPDFERIALCRDGGPVEIRSLPDLRLLATLAPSTNAPVYDNSTWSPDGKYFAVKRDIFEAGHVADWEIWDVSSVRRVAMRHDIVESAASFHPSLPRFISAKLDGLVQITDLQTGVLVNQFLLPVRPVYLSFSPDGTRFATDYSINDEWKLSIHDASTGKMLAIHVFDDRMVEFAWHPSGRWIAVPAHSGSVFAMDASTGEARVIGQHKSDAVLATFTPDGGYLFTGGWDNEMICFDAVGQKPVFTMKLGTYRLQIGSDGSAFAVLPRSSVQLYDFQRPDSFRRFSEVSGVQFRQAAFSADSKWLAASDSRTLAVWDLSEESPAAIVAAGYESRPYFSPNATELFASRHTEGEHIALRWRIKRGPEGAATPSLARLPLNLPDDFTYLSCHSNSAVITASRGSVVLAPEQLENGDLHWSATKSGLNGVSPDGRWLGIYSPFAKALNIYKLPGLSPAALLQQESSISDFAFSPRGDELAVSSTTGIAFWSTSNWRRTRALSSFFHIQYTAEGRTCWLSKQLSGAGLYDVRTLKPLLLLPSDLFPVAVSPDGHYLAATAARGQLQLWDLQALKRELGEIGLSWVDQTDVSARAR